MNEISFKIKMNQYCYSRIPLLKKDGEIEIGAKNLSNGPIELQNGEENQLRYNCSTVELKSKVYSVLFIHE
jgi:hypothetical protein